MYVILNVWNPVATLRDSAERRKETGHASIWGGRRGYDHKLVNKSAKGKNASLYLPLKIPRIKSK